MYLLITPFKLEVLKILKGPFKFKVDIYHNFCLFDLEQENKRYAFFF